MNRRFKWKDGNFIILLILAWILSVLFVNPVGEFPLNDDAVFSYPVKNLLEQGTIELKGLSAPNVILQVFWGYLFCKIGGEFSFTTLRFSTLFLGLIALAMSFLLAKEYFKDTPKARLATILLFINPVFFSISFSFMTDVPFLSLAIIALFFYHRFFVTNNNTYRIAGLIMASLAFFIRQPGIILLFSFELFVFLFRADKKKSFLPFISALLFMLFLYLGMEHLKEFLNIKDKYIKVGGIYLEQLFQNPLWFIFNIPKRALMTVFYMGFFTLPLLPFIFRKVKELGWLSKKVLIAVLVFNVIVIFVLSQFNRYFPYGGIYFYNFGVGPILLRDVFPLKLDVLPRLPYWVMMIFGLLCQINGCYLVGLLIRKIWRSIQKPRSNKFVLFLSGFNILYLGAMTVFSYFDRYLMLPFFSVLLIVLPELKISFRRFNWSASLIILFALFTFLGTKDYFNFNRACYSAWEYLKKEGVSFEDIDGGSAFNDFYKNKPYDWDEPYIITISRLEGYVVEKKISFFRNLFLEKDSIFILRKSQDRGSTSRTKNLSSQTGIFRH